MSGDPAATGSPFFSQARSVAAEITCLALPVMKEMQKVLQHLHQHFDQAGVRLIAVSKTHPPESIRTLYDLGVRDFGENRVQEMVTKAPLLPEDIRWHLIGHLQTNKVKYITGWVHMIQSVDSLKLLQEIEKQAARQNRTIPILFQYHVAMEAGKYGLNPKDDQWLYALKFKDTFPHILPCGVMGIATLTDDLVQIRSEFRQLRAIFNRLKADLWPDEASFREISMGMSSDYQIAVEEGSTMVRIGSLLFGDRH